MIDLKDRIKQIRNEKGYSQQKFASELGVSFSNIQSYETGRRNPAEAFKQLLCDKYSINRKWLETGEGEMHPPKTREKEIADLAKEMLYADETDFKWQLIELIANMPPDMIEYLKNFTIEYAQKINKHPDN